MLHAKVLQLLSVSQLTMYRNHDSNRQNQMATSACLLLSKAEVALAQVKEDGLVELGQPGMYFALGHAGPQPCQVAAHSLPQAGQHQSAQQLVLQSHNTADLGLKACQNTQIATSKMKAESAARSSVLPVPLVTAARHVAQDPEPSDRDCKPKSNR